jgi:uncharacterized protein (TIGR03086 family)
MADSFDQQLDVLRRALDQAGDAISEVTEEQLSLSTPCPDWKVTELISHLLQDVERFTLGLQGGEPDWSAQPEPVSGDWAADFRTAADALVTAWQDKGEAEPPGPIWQSSEIAIHTWDLVRATAQDRQLDADVAEQALAFMSNALTPENRGDSFGAELDAPADAPAYDRLVAFAGRDPA